MRKKFGARLRYVRRLRRMTQAQLADALQEYDIDISPSTVSAWERGIRAVTLDQFCAMVHILDVLPRELLGIHWDKPHTKILWTARKDVIARYGVFDWAGDKLALWEFIALFMALPPPLRADVAGLGIHLYKKAARQGLIAPDIPAPDLDMLISTWAAATTHKDKQYL